MDASGNGLRVLSDVRVALALHGGFVRVISGSLGRRSSRTGIVAPALSSISLVLLIVGVVVDLMSRRSRRTSVRVAAFNLRGFRQLFVAAVMVCMIFGIIREVIAAVIDVATLVVVVIYESVCVVFDHDGGVNACAKWNNASFIPWVYVVVLDRDGSALAIRWFRTSVRVIEGVM